MDISLPAKFSQRLQGQYVLPAARILYLIGAAGSLAAVIGGLGFALIFHLKAQQSPVQEFVPAAATVTPVAIDIAALNTRLTAPTNVSVAYSGLIYQPLQLASVVGIFSATTPNGLAAFPNDILILGGSDASLFERSGQELSSGSGKHTVLRPAAELIKAVNKEMATLTAPVTHQYSLRVAARDIYGNLSMPVDVTLALTFGPAPAAPAPSPTTAASVAAPQSAPLTPYQMVARDLALIVDPNRTPAYFEVYQRALRAPGECGVNDNNPAFAADARNAFERVKAMLTAANIEGFHAGLCTAWRQARSEEDAALQQANTMRAAVISRNTEERIRVQVEAAEAMSVRNFSLIFAGGAILAFLVVALLLAILAIENHSKVIRESLEALKMGQKSQGGMA